MYVIEPQKEKYSVVEMETRYVMGIFDKKAKAEKVRTRLNLGHGFAGQTPTFFIDRTIQGE